jgi:hypothetical protein
MLLVALGLVGSLELGQGYLFPSPRPWLPDDQAVERRHKAHSVIHQFIG